MSTRRDFIKRTAMAATASVAGITLPAEAANFVTDSDMTRLKWSKAPCRFCGTGCGVTVAVKDNKVVATQGDPQAEVNRGLNCVKGYFLSRIMYGKDRLTQPLVRGEDGELHETTWEHALETAATGLRGVVDRHGPQAVGFLSSARLTNEENYLIQKLARAVIGTNSVHSCEST